MAKNLIAKPATTLPDYLKTDTSVGNENISADDLTVPYISLLQSISKPCTKGSPEYVKGAEPGQFYNTVTKEVSDELLCANMFVNTVFSVNKKRQLGDDFQGEFALQEDAMEHLEAEGLNPSDYDIKENHKHTLALFDAETGNLESAAIFSFRNTALKASRLWNTQILSAYPNADRFAGIWRITPQTQSNNMGSWFTPNIELAGYPSEEVYDVLKEKYNLWHNKD
jgi:hypothetical protein